MHKQSLCNVEAISSTGAVYVRPMNAKQFIKTKIDELREVELNPEILKKLGFTCTSDHFTRQNLYLTNTRGYPSYIIDIKGHRVSIGMITAVHMLQNIFYDLYLVPITLMELPD